MPQFEFRGTTRTGQAVTETRAAPSREALDALLRREGITPTRIVEKGREIAVPKPKVVGRVSAKELAIFTRQFSVMIDAGLPLVQGRPLRLRRRHALLDRCGCGRRLVHVATVRVAR